MRVRLLALALVVVGAVLGAVLSAAVAVRQSTAQDADVVAAILADAVGAASPASSDGAAPEPETAGEQTTPLGTPSPEPSADPAPRPAVALAPGLGEHSGGLLAAVRPVRGTGPAGPAPTLPPPRPAATQLTRRLERILSSPELVVSGDAGVAVVDRWGREVISEHGRAPLVPASTNKLVVAAAALELLGGEARLRTAIATTAPPDERGIVHGDLVLVGGGDPTLASPEYAKHVYPIRPRTPISRLVDGVAEAGITRVTGRVVGDSRMMPGTALPQGWSQGYLDRLEGTRVSGLTVDAGRRLWERESDQALLGAASEDPAMEAATVLTRLLEEADVRVDGEPTVVADGADRAGSVAPEVVDDAEVIATVTSPPLAELLIHMVQNSDNHIADSLFRLLGALAGDGTWSGSSRAVRAALADLDLDWSGARLLDGSGLSRANRLPPLLLADLDRGMLATSSAHQWRELMAVAGTSGTLRHRYAGTPAEGRLHGKTGSLRDVRALAGSVDGPGGSRWHFAVVGSDLRGPDVGRVRRMTDLVVYALAAEQRGCGEWRPPPPAQERQDPGEPTPDRPAPPEAAVCP